MASLAQFAIRMLSMYIRVAKRHACTGWQSGHCRNPRDIDTEDKNNNPRPKKLQLQQEQGSLNCITCSSGCRPCVMARGPLGHSSGRHQSPSVPAEAAGKGVGSSKSCHVT
jgi:hypothetical protein